MSNAAYAPIKSMTNWYTIWINAEDDWLNCFAIDSGHVSTNLGDRAAQAVGMGKAPVSVKDSCEGMMKLHANANKKKNGGNYLYTLASNLAGNMDYRSAFIGSKFKLHTYILPFHYWMLLVYPRLLRSVS
jgi:hypothetical protein